MKSNTKKNDARPKDIYSSLWLWEYSAEEKVWIRKVYSAILRTARTNSQFTVDDIWAEIHKMEAKGSIPKHSGIDHRILGPMLRHMVVENLIDSTGYYTKSTRSGGGSRPVTIWKSHTFASAVAA